MILSRVAVCLSMLFWALLCGGGVATAQPAPEFSIRADVADGGRPQVALRGILQDATLRRALESGLPLRFHLRVELWKKGLFDRLVVAEESYLALLQDPLDRAYRLDTGRAERRYGSLAEVQQALEVLLRVGLQPRGGAGRYYYLGALDIETLSLSDLEELRRWLRGEVQPAIEGRASPARAVERGLRRVFVRVIGLPTRRYEARSETFVLR